MVLATEERHYICIIFSCIVDILLRHGWKSIPELQFGFIDSVLTCKVINWFLALAISQQMNKTLHLMPLFLLSQWEKSCDLYQSIREELTYILWPFWASKRRTYKHASAVTFLSQWDTLHTLAVTFLSQLEKSFDTYIGCDLSDPMREELTYIHWLWPFWPNEGRTYIHTLAVTFLSQLEKSLHSYIGSDFSEPIRELTYQWTNLVTQECNISIASAVAIP